MGSYTFKWTKPADQVYVTGTFDNWRKSSQLERVGDSFEKTVELPDVSEKIYYKFVVDNNWVTDLSAPLEKDSEGNENNVLTPEEIVVSAPPSAAIMSGVTPESTTAQLAAAAPLEKKASETLTPATEAIAEKAAEVKDDAEKVVEEAKADLSEKVAAAGEKVEGFKPTESLPTAEDIPQVETPMVPGNFPATPADELEKPVGINPMPATENGLNPVKLAPGEPVPETIAGGNINEHVKLDKESYEKADTLPGDVGAAAAAAMSVPPVSDQMIPESSLPIAGADDVHISSAAPEATTAALAAGAPIETKKDEVPEVVKESQNKAGVDPEASAIPEEVKEKAEVEAELLDKVPEVPTAAEGAARAVGDKTEAAATTSSEAAAAVAGAAVAVGGAAVAAMFAAKDTVVEKAAEAAANLPAPVKDALPAQAKEAIAAASADKTLKEISPAVPAQVKESIVEAKDTAKAAVDTEAAADKAKVETELLKEVEKVAPVETTTAAAAAVPSKADEIVKSAEAKADELTKSAETKADELAKTVETSETPKVPEAAPANGEAPVESTAGPSTAASTTESPEATQIKKKKNRLSSMFSKVKSKMSSKH